MKQIKLKVVMQIAIQFSCYMAAGFIPYFMVTAEQTVAAEQKLGYALYYFPLFALPILALLYFSEPLASIGMCFFATVIGLGGLIFSDFRSGLIFLLQIGWCWSLFWIAQEIIERKDLEVHRLEEENEKLELNCSETDQQKKILENGCAGILRRIASYLQLQLFTDQITSILQVKEIQEKTQTTLKRIFEIEGEKEKDAVRLNFFPAQESSEKHDPIRTWIFKQRIPLLIEDCAQDARFPSLQLREKGSMMVCPLERESAIVGTIHVRSASPKKWRERDLRFFSDLSNIVSLAATNAVYYEKIESLAVKDSLTDLFVRYRFDERMEEEFARAQMTRSPLALLLFDIDHFKAVNDRWGHAAGDAVLKSVAQIILKTTRETDFCARYGGEEIAVIMPLTQLENAAHIAERIRQNVESLSIGSEKINVTLSGGVARLLPAMSQAQELIESADRALYRAKSEGRNRILKDSL